MTTRSDQKSDVQKREGGIGEVIRTVVYAVLIAVVIRTVAYEPFNIPSGSMLPTLLVGDYVFVAKYSYGYSKHSMPWSPALFDGRILASEVERGDVAVFKLPADNSTDYIKRIIGLPGDELQMIDSVLHINGEPVQRERVDDFSIRNHYRGLSHIAQYKETLPNGVQYMTLDLRRTEADNTGVFTVPEGHYFAMGDNRDDSLDSRFLNHVGFIPAENLVGRADIKFFSIDDSISFWQVWKWPTAIRYGRILRPIN